MARRGTDVVVSRGKLERLPRPASLFGAFDRLFDDFFPDIGPSVDVIDRDDEVVVRAEVPGFRKEDIEISVSGDLLTLSGATSREEKEERGTYYRAEITRGAFSRTLMLPAEVDDSKAKATMRDGLLELRLPKVERSRRRTITIE